jgi:hypothetical protein
VAGRQDEVLAALALVNPSRADIFDGGLPVVHDAAVDCSLVSGWDLQHHRADVLGVDEGHQVDDVGVGRQGLVLPVQQARPVHELVEVGLGVTDGRLEHHPVVDRRHAPDDRLHRTPHDGPFAELLGIKRAWHCTCRLSIHDCPLPSSPILPPRQDRTPAEAEGEPM